MDRRDSKEQLTTMVQSNGDCEDFRQQVDIQTPNPIQATSTRIRPPVQSSTARVAENRLCHPSSISRNLPCPRSRFAFLCRLNPWPGHKYWVNNSPQTSTTTYLVKHSHRLVCLHWYSVRLIRVYQCTVVLTPYSRVVHYSLCCGSNECPQG